MKEYLLNQSLAIRTNILPEVKNVADTVRPDYNSTRHYKTDIIKWLSPIINLEGYSVYPSNGITEGLNWFMGNTKHNIWRQPGEYQWVDNINNRQAPHIEYQSIPSAIDGNFHPVSGNSKVALDLAYVGSTRIQKIEIHSGVEHVFFSLSKPFGIRNIRTGWYFTKHPDEKLEKLIYSAKYYNYYAQEVAEKIINNFDIDYVHKQLYNKQKSVCEQLGFTPSDSVWLGSTTDREYIKFMRDGINARICLAGVYNEETSITNHI